jgi:acetylornithine deacetylase
LQNNPPELIPEEDRVVNHVLNSLLSLSTATGGGPLILNHVTYFPGRGNLIVEYPGSVPGKILSFVGCHMDVVTANPDDWVFIVYEYLFIYLRTNILFYDRCIYEFILCVLNNLNLVFMKDFDPFTLSIDGDKLGGRGTTDCLGHVALVTELMKKLGETKPDLKSTVVAVFIANEESSVITGVGIDALVQDCLLNKLKEGPM